MRRGKRLHDAERYEILAAVYAKDGCEVHQEDVGAYRTKIVEAGDFLYVTCYPLISTGRRQEQETILQDLKKGMDIKRAAKYARYNNARRIESFEQLVHANFGKGDFHVCCTYEQEDYDDPDTYAKPSRTREDACREIRNYIRRVKRLLKRNGCDLKYFRWVLCTVSKEYDQESPRPRPDRHHHHMLMHGIPENLRSEIEKLWEFGYCNADRLQPNDKGVAQMAGYIARQEGNANGERFGERSFSTSRNIIKPRVQTSDCKISVRRASLIAADVRANGKKIFEKIWSKYRLVEDVKVGLSDFVAGAYIRARLRKR